MQSPLDVETKVSTEKKVSKTLIELLWKLTTYEIVEPFPGCQVQTPTVEIAPHRLNQIIDTVNVTEEDYSDVQIAPILITDDVKEKEELIHEALDSVACEEVHILHSYTGVTGFLSVQLVKPTYFQIIDLIYGLGLCSFDGQCELRVADGVNYLVVD